MENILLEENEPEQTGKCNKCNKKLLFVIIMVIISAVIGIILIYYFVFYDKSSSNSESRTFFDFIVIGSGPSGSIVATRLASNGYSVLLLESGNTTQHEVNGTLNVTPSTNLTLFDIPLDWDIITINSSYSSKYIYFPNGAIIPQIARGIGGSGAVNAMIYIRGTVTDFTLQNGWIGQWNNYTNILKYYLRSENNTNIFNSSFHNNSGNVHISHNYNYNTNLLSNAFINACIDYNFSITKDMNPPNRSHNICGNYQFLIDNNYDNNQTIRDSIARAFYRNNIKPKTLTIKPNSMVIDVIFDKDKKTAIGVNYIDLNNNKLQSIYVKNEIILSAGTLNTPTILMQSGIGDADILKNRFKFTDDDIILNNTFIGRNYIDGVFTYIQWNVTNELIDNFTLCTPWNSTFGYDNKYYVNKCKLEWNKYMKIKEDKSVFDTTGFNVGGFFRSPYSMDISDDIQVTLQPFDILFRYNKTNILTAQIANNLPQSVGYIQWNHLNDIKRLDRIVSNGSNIEVIGNYLENENDVNALVYGINLTRNIFKTDAINKYVISELIPGYNTNSNNELKQYVITNKQSASHIIGTSKMGYVVNDELKVIGLNNIRIVDASIMASLPSGNTHATCMMIGEYAADLLLQDNHVQVA